jgi:hypothetical protein
MNINPCSILLGLCLYILIGFVATEVLSGEYYIYRDSNGVLVISNKNPPPGSKIIKQRDLQEETDSQVPRINERDTQSCGGIECSPEFSNSK